MKQYLALPFRVKLVVACRLLRDPRVPFVAKLVIPFVGLYLLTPIDIIPDFIPIVGQLDDLLIAILGVTFHVIDPGRCCIQLIDPPRCCSSVNMSPFTVGHILEH
ncbi:MAG: DUF1232 domain-containing protein [Chloroflexi bacterium]|nr:DUF1232 domain-containing protein [Chloroflexota bacterium]